jgi:hypothetical protein
MTGLTLTARRGEFADLAALAAALAGACCAPTATLLEPRAFVPGPDESGRARRCAPLSPGLPDLAGIPASELLLSWPDACCRAVLQDGRLRWASLAVAGSWQPLDGEGKPLPDVVGIAEMLPRRRVIWRGDLARFLASDTPGDLPWSPRDLQFDLREFRRAGWTFAWWLAPPPKESADKKETSGA